MNISKTWQRKKKADKRWIAYSSQQLFSAACFGLLYMKDLQLQLVEARQLDVIDASSVLNYK